jgi:CHASE2 domain-containing sensor protein
MNDDPNPDADRISQVFLAARKKRPVERRKAIFWAALIGAAFGLLAVLASARPADGRDLLLIAGSAIVPALFIVLSTRRL